MLFSQVFCPQNEEGVCIQGGCGVCIQGGVWGLHPGGWVDPRVCLRGAEPPPRDTWDTVNKWAVRILLERILVLFTILFNMRYSVAYVSRKFCKMICNLNHIFHVFQRFIQRNSRRHMFCKRRHWPSIQVLWRCLLLYQEALLCCLFQNFWRWFHPN